MQTIKTLDLNENGMCCNSFPAMLMLMLHVCHNHILQELTKQLL